MAKFNLREALVNLDIKSDFKYHLTELYEACDLDEKDKKNLVKMVANPDPDSAIVNTMLAERAGVCKEICDDDLSDEEFACIKCEVQEDVEDLQRVWKRSDKEIDVIDVMSDLSREGYKTRPMGNGSYKVFDKSGNTSIDVQFNLEPVGVAYDFTINGKENHKVTLSWDEMEVRQILKRAADEANFKTFDIDIDEGAHPDCANTESCFKPGDTVYVKPSKKLGRVVKVNGDYINVEVIGGKDPDRNDTFYASDLELQDTLGEAWEPEFDPEDWEDKDIELWKSIDWAGRNYREYPVEEDGFNYYAVAYGMEDGDKYAEVPFIKYLRPNPIYPPYYAPKDQPFDGVVGPMFDGRTKGKYDIHNRYETQEVYNALSESVDKDEPWSNERVEDEITSMTMNFTRDKDSLITYYKEEADVAEKALKKHYDNVKVTELKDRFEISFSSPIEKSLRESAGRFNLEVWVPGSGGDDDRERFIMSSNSIEEIIEKAHEIDLDGDEAFYLSDMKGIYPYDLDQCYDAEELEDAIYNEWHYTPMGDLRKTLGKALLPQNEAYKENPRDFKPADEDGFIFDEETGKRIKIDYDENGEPVEVVKEAIEMTADEMKDKHGTDNPDIINAGKEEKDRVALRESSQGKMQCIADSLNVSDFTDNDKIVFTDNGAYDLEKQGISGIYLWVGYKHSRSGRTNQKLSSEALDVAYDVKEYLEKTYGGKATVENRISTTDMCRVWIVDAGKPEEERVALKEDGYIEDSDNFDFGKAETHMPWKYSMSEDEYERYAYQVEQGLEKLSYEQIERMIAEYDIDYVDADFLFYQPYLYALNPYRLAHLHKRVDWACSDNDIDMYESLTEAMTYTDTNGFLGEPGEKYTMSQFRRMWQDKDNDPSMSAFDSFEEWVGETISHMDAHEEADVAPSGRGKLSCATFTDNSGIMGTVGEKYTVNDLADYWEDNKGSDPVLAAYNGDWKAWLDDTIDQMEIEYDSCLFDESLIEDHADAMQRKTSGYDKCYRVVKRARTANPIDTEALNDARDHFGADLYKMCLDDVLKEIEEAKSPKMMDESLDFFDTVTVKLDDDDMWGGYSWELENKYGWYQGQVIFEDDPRLKEIGAKPGDTILCGLEHTDKFGDDIDFDIVPIKVLN